uniref:Uncharacterized protein n=1 Tax=Panagrolaimus sp. JU765 TaxID=591449 RepID=A0AC34RGL4_9BILA
MLLILSLIISTFGIAESRQRLPNFKVYYHSEQNGFYLSATWIYTDENGKNPFRNTAAEFVGSLDRNLIKECKKNGTFSYIDRVSGVFR